VTNNLQELKKNLSPRLLQIAGVSGVGTAGGKLTVYLDEDLPGIKHKVLDIVGDCASDADVQFVVTGVFRAAASNG